MISFAFKLLYCNKEFRVELIAYIHTAQIYSPSQPVFLTLLVVSVFLQHSKIKTGKLRVNFSLCLTKYHALKMCLLLI
jgi:hypothetical protein